MQSLLFISFREIRFVSILLFLVPANLLAQERLNYFPERGAAWETKKPADLQLDEAKLQKAVDFAQSNEYTGPRDLCQAILTIKNHNN